MKLPGDAALAKLLIDGSEEPLKQYGEDGDLYEILQVLPATLRRIYWQMNVKSLFQRSLEAPGWQYWAVLAKAVKLLLSILPRADFRHTGLLCAALWRVRDRLWTPQQAIFDERLAPLLLALDEDQAQSLSEDARRWIRWRLKRNSSPEFRIAALLTLASTGDAKLAPIARALRHTADERVRAAAGEALRATKTK